MKWIYDYWYLIVSGLVAAMVLFGYRSKSTGEGMTKDDEHETHDDGKDHKDGHGCCC